MLVFGDFSCVIYVGFAAVFGVPEMPPELACDDHGKFVGMFSVGRLVFSQRVVKRRYRVVLVEEIV